MGIVPLFGRTETIDARGVGSVATTTPPPLAWEWTAGADDRVQLVNDIASTRDGGVVCAGIEEDESGVQNVLLRKVDSAGKTVWAETIGGDDHDAALAVSPDGDGGFVLAGGTRSFGSSRMNTVVGRTAPNGDLQWFEPIGRAGTNDAAHAVARADDGGYVVAGGTHYLGGASGDGAGRLAKVDEGGSLVWDDRYEADYAGEIYDVVATDDGGFAFVGTREGDSGDGRAWLGTVDADGNLEWSRRYGGAGDRTGFSLVATADGGFAFAGTTQPPGTEPTAWIVKVDADGGLEWERTYGGAESDVASSILQDDDGGYSIAGWTGSQGDGAGDAGWLAKLDGVGAVEWEETYGDDGADRFTGHVRTSGNGYAAGGYASSPDAEPSAWAVGLGHGQAVAALARGIDEGSFLSSFAGTLRDDASAEHVADRSIERITDAAERGDVSEAVATEAIDRLAIGHEGTLELLRLAGPGADGVDDRGAPTNVLDYSRRIAEYAVSIITDLVMEKLALGEKLSEVVPDRLTRAVDEFGDRLDVGGGDSPLSMSFFDDIIDYVLDLTFDADDVRSETLWRISSEAEDAFETVWAKAPDEIEAGADLLTGLVEDVIDGVTSIIAKLILAGYETGGLDVFVTAKRKRHPRSEPDAVGSPVGLQAIAQSGDGTWRALSRLESEIPSTVEAGDSLAGSTEDARRAKSETVESVREDMENSGAWLDLLVEDLTSFGIVENFLSALGAIKEIWEADNWWDRAKSVVDGAIDVIKGLLGIVTTKVGLVTSVGSALIAADVLAHTANANVAVVDAVVAGTDRVGLETPYDHVPAPDETIPAYDEFKELL